MGQSGLSNARHIFHQQMTPGKESDQTLSYHFCFALDHRLDGLDQTVNLFLLFDFEQKVPPSPYVFLSLNIKGPSLLLSVHKQAMKKF